MFFSTSQFESSNEIIMISANMVISSCSTPCSWLCSAEKAWKKSSRENWIQQVECVFTYIFFSRCIFYLQPLQSNSTVYIFNTSPRNLNICTHFKSESILKNERPQKRALSTHKFCGNKTQKAHTSASDHWTQRASSWKTSQNIYGRLQWHWL